MLSVGPSQHRVLMRARADEVTFGPGIKGRSSVQHPSIHPSLLTAINFLFTIAL